MGASTKLDAQTEIKVVTMLARNDTYQQIVDWLKNEQGVEISVKTIPLIKKRNIESYNFMKGKMVEHEATLSTSLLDKSRRLLDKQLDKALTLEEDLAKLEKRYDEGEIDEKDYWRMVDVALRSKLTVKDLTSISKESFNQSQIEQGKPTSIAENPAQAKESLGKMLSAIANNDQAAMLRTLFPDA